MWRRDDVNQKCSDCGCYVQEVCWITMAGGCLTGLLDALVLGLLSSLFFPQTQCPLCKKKFAKNRRPPFKFKSPDERHVICLIQHFSDPGTRDLATSLAADYGLKLTVVNTVNDLIAKTNHENAPVLMHAAVLDPALLGERPGEVVWSLRERGFSWPVILLTSQPLTTKAQRDLGADDYVRSVPSFAPQFLFEVVARDIHAHEQAAANAVHT